MISLVCVSNMVRSLGCGRACGETLGSKFQQIFEKPSGNLRGIGIDVFSKAWADDLRIIKINLPVTSDVRIYIMMSVDVFPISNLEKTFNFQFRLWRPHGDFSHQKPFVELRDLPFRSYDFHSWSGTGVGLDGGPGETVLGFPSVRCKNDVNYHEYTYHYHTIPYHAYHTIYIYVHILYSIPYHPS